MSYWLLGGVVLYLAGCVLLGCHLKRRAEYETRVSERLREMASGVWDPRP